MFKHTKIQRVDDFFLELINRKEKNVFFYRINGYSDEIGEFIKKYYEAARVSGVVLEEKIPNPTEKNLEYYDEIMGIDFQMNLDFILNALKKWLPRMDNYQRESVAKAMYHSLDILKQSGKNDNMLKNAFIKFMCWLYYKFERIVSQLGANKIPKILYQGDISKYELMLISILSNAGCDVVLLQYEGDKNYLQLDANNSFSNNLEINNLKPFPKEFNLQYIRDEIKAQMQRERLYGNKAQLSNCTNAWIEGKGLADILKESRERGNESSLFYNCYCRINGVEDKTTYVNELYQFQLELKNKKRKIVIIDKSISPPSMEEIKAVERTNYEKTDQMLIGLSKNIKHKSNMDLQYLMIKSFIDVMQEEAAISGENLNRLTNKAVYLLCWLKRYQDKLFLNWKMPDISCFIYMGALETEAEVLFIKFLSNLPVDVLILKPNLNLNCCLTDKLLYEINNINSLEVEKFPQENTEVRIGTVAYHAERELDTLIYQDSGVYRNKQHAKANVVILKTMYEEIAILWDQELKYRPNFSISEDVVNMPVIFSKISGVKDGDTSNYWESIKKLAVEDSYIIRKVPFIDIATENPIKAYATEFFKHGKVRKQTIKNHKSYQYSFLRDEIQDYILDKLQMLIDQKIIKGTFENGTEYTIVSTVLNLEKELLRLIQKFDFTKKNPKLIYINTSEKIISLEDSILVAFLNLIGFDIVFYIPTGYQNIEKYFTKQLMEEHQIGEYKYELQVPIFDKFSSNKKLTWRDKIFKRGN